MELPDSRQVFLSLGSFLVLTVEAGRGPAWTNRGAGGEDDATAAFSRCMPHQLAMPAAARLDYALGVSIGSPRPKSPI
jgi:hypothetical protein